MGVKLVSASGGSVELVAPATATNYTATMPANTGTVITTASSAVVSQTMLATGVVGNGPAFCAYQNSAQTLSSNTDTKIRFQAEEWDTASCFDSTTNYRFTPNVAGYYLLNFAMQVGVSSTGLVLTLYKNGSPYKQMGNSNSNCAQLTGSVVVYLNGSTDYVEFYGLAVSGQALGANSLTTWCEGSMVRAA